MEELIDWTNDTLKNKSLHPIILIAIFVVHFLAIHPFQDGNGRLSRALTNLLLLKSGYNYVLYSSLEAVIEDNKEAYYLALRKTQSTFKSSSPDYETWIDFFTKSLEKQKLRLEYKLEHINSIDNNTNNNLIGLSSGQKNKIDNKSKTIQSDQDSFDFSDLPETAVKILQLFNDKERLTISYIKNNIDDSEGKIKRALILLQDKKIIKKHGVTNGCWYVKI